MKGNITEQLVHQYLLGDLREEEQLALEQEYFTNAEALERVWEIENQLVDSYVCGTLSRDKQRLFEQNYLASPVHRNRVKVAATLLETIDSSSEKRRAVRPAPMSWWSTLLLSVRRNSWQWATGAAVVLLLALSIVLLSDRARLRRQSEQITAESLLEQQRTQELEKEIAAQRDQSDKLAAEITRLHEEPPTVEGPAQPSQTEGRSVLSVVLSPMLMRSEGETPQLTLTKETAAVVIQMRLQQPDLRAYRVDLRTVEGVNVWSSSSVRARTTKKDRSTVSVTIPAGKLVASDYILTLSATDGANETEEINRYFFKVSKE